MRVALMDAWVFVDTDRTFDDNASMLVDNLSITLHDVTMFVNNYRIHIVACRELHKGFSTSIEMTFTL